MLLIGYMKDNKLIIAAAGAGKTTYIVDEAFHRKGRVLITTFTEENEAEINDKFFTRYGGVPGHITVQTWFSFLLQHGVKPYQGTCKDFLFHEQIKGILLVNEQSGFKAMIPSRGKMVPIYFGEKTEFREHYFTKEMRLYTDKLAKFVVRANEASSGNVIDRISHIFSTIYIDEVQDLAGYDLEIIKLLFHSTSSVICVGDPRQVTYYTHWETMNKIFRNGNVKGYVQSRCYKSDNIVIDEQTLCYSHRNNQQICDFSSLLYPEFPKAQSCSCPSCHQNGIEHQGVFLLKMSEIDAYLEKFSPVQLRHSIKVKTDSRFSSYNFGKSKGKTFDRVLIYPTADIKKWLANKNNSLADPTRAALYVAITRARYSVAFVIPDNEIGLIYNIDVWSA